MSTRLLGLVVVLAAIWSAYWLVAYYFASSAVGWAEIAETEGGPLFACAERGFGGFPLQVTVNCSGIEAATGDGVRASLFHVAAAAPLYVPGRVTAEVVGPLRVEAPTFTLDASWAKGEAAADTGLLGAIVATAAFDGFNLFVEEVPGTTLWSARATQWATEIRPAPETADAIRVELATQDLIVTLGDMTFPDLTGNATLTLLESGSRLDRDPMAIVRTWLAAGGAFTIDNMHLASGRVVADVTGSMVLELDGTLSGNFVMRYSGEEDLPLLVAAVFPWRGDHAEDIAAAIVALSRSLDVVPGQPEFEIRLSLRHGSFTYGLIPIPEFTVPSIGDLHHLL